MQTRTGSTSASPRPESDALDAAMRAHPVVLDTIERMAATRRKVEAERDRAVSDLAAERLAHRKTKAALEVVQETNEKMLKAIGTLPAGPPATGSGGAPALSDAEALAKWASWSPEERAAALIKTAPSRRITMRGGGSMPAGSVFGR